MAAAFVERCVFNMRFIDPKAFATGAAVMLYALNSVFFTARQTLGAALALWLA